jgi:carbon storage regulator
MNGLSSTEITHMLVLSRKESERIRLGDSIVVTVVRVAGDKVRLGIEAPADILVLRDELEPAARAVVSPDIHCT